MKGIYCLIIFLDKDKSINIGKRIIFFPKGFYCYVGSALNSLKKRIERHYKKNKKMHWHIDYFLKEAAIIDIKTTNNKNECRLSRKISKLADSAIKGFGSSDCKCLTHLYYFKKNPSKAIEKVFKVM